MKSKEFSDHISLYETNLRRKFDRFIRFTISEIIKDFSIQLKINFKEIKQINKNRTLSTYEKDKFILKIEDNLQEIKALIDEKLNRLVEKSYGVEIIEFTKDIEVNFLKILQKINKITSKLS